MNFNFFVSSKFTSAGTKKCLLYLARIPASSLKLFSVKETKKADKDLERKEEMYLEY